MLIKLFVTLFVIFAVSRVLLRYREGRINVPSMLLWNMLWVGIEIFVWLPKITDRIAGKIGIGRGADALVYISIITLFYGLFRLYMKQEAIEQEITNLVRALALRDEAARRFDSRHGTEKK